jgi:Tfp pilus assembly protein PilV
MITLIVAGIGLLVLVAIVVGIVEATQAASWRQIAAERRARWEARQPQPHGPDQHSGSQPYDEHDESWDDD